MEAHKMTISLQITGPEKMRYSIKKLVTESWVGLGCVGLGCGRSVSLRSRVKALTITNFLAFPYAYH